MRSFLYMSLLRKFAGTTLLFSGFIGVGTSLVLFFASCLGYLPYSDRPGPGWWGRVHWPSLMEFGNYAGLAPWFSYFCLFFGIGLFGLSIVFEFSSMPIWLVRLIGGLVSALAAGLAAMAAGWYIALAEIGPDAAIVLGLIYGVSLYPRFVQPRVTLAPLGLRIGAPLVATLMLLYWIMSPLLPKTPVPGIKYNLIRVSAGDESVSVNGMGKEVATEVAILRLGGEVHGGVAGSASGTGDAPLINVQLIALEPITAKSKLMIPKNGYVVYVLKNGAWTAHPHFSETEKRLISVEPGIDEKYDGGQVAIGKLDHAVPFTWYPVIPKGQ